MNSSYEDCLFTDIVVARDLGIPISTKAKEVNIRPRLAGKQVTRECIGCQAMCTLLEAVDAAPKYVGDAEEQLQDACPDEYAEVVI